MSIASAAFLSLGACATMQVRSNHDPSADFSAYTTFDWVAQTQLRTGSRRLDDPYLHSVIRSAIEREFQAAEIKRSNPPSVWLQYHVAIESKTRAVALDLGDKTTPAWGRDYWTGKQLGEPGTYVEHFDVGTLIIDVIDAKTGQPVWRATAQTEVDKTDARSKKAARIKKAVRRMIDRFPRR